MARYRCGNEMRGGQHWKEERVCRMCKKEEEDLAHVIGKCEETKEEITIAEFLRGDGKRLKIMRRIGKEKRRRGKRGTMRRQHEKAMRGKKEKDKEQRAR